MPSNHTPNYALSQWERTDKILMEDFNEDNAKIDGALAALAEATAGKGNCRIVWGSYQGTGKTGKSSAITLTFDKKPLLVVVLPGG